MEEGSGCDMIDEIPTTLYHGTSHPSADTTGLDPYEAPGAQSDGLSNGAAVYLADTPEQAREYGPHVYSVNAEGLPLDLVDNAYDGYDYLALHHIEPTRIQRYASTQIAPDLKSLLPKQAEVKPDPRPIEFLWVYDPQEAEVHLEVGKGHHPAHFPTHHLMAKHVTHPDRQEGYAYSIMGGWRITTDDHKKLEDPFILKKVRAALRQEHPPKALPHIRYHGSPYGDGGADESL